MTQMAADGKAAPRPRDDRCRAAVEAFTGGDLGDVDWQGSGSNVTGTLTKDGKQVATFEGAVGATEMSGTYGLLSRCSGFQRQLGAIDQRCRLAANFGQGRHRTALSLAAER
jgi:hypothetical protein